MILLNNYFKTEDRIILRIY